MTNQSINKICFELLSRIKAINLELNFDDNNADDMLEIDNLHLIKKRQSLLEALFTEEHKEWLSENNQTLVEMQTEIELITSKYRDYLDVIKSKLLLTKKSKKGLNIYKNIT